MPPAPVSCCDDDTPEMGLVLEASGPFGLSSGTEVTNGSDEDVWTTEELTGCCLLLLLFELIATDSDVLVC